MAETHQLCDPAATAIAMDVAANVHQHLRQPFLSPAILDPDGPTIAQHINHHMDLNNSNEQQHHHTGFHSQDLIDQSNHHTAEQVVALSPNGRYGRLNTLLGKGAFKVVHKAIDREEGYEVAWNVLQIGQENNKDIGHEIEILKSVRHPNIIAFHDAWLDESKTEFVFVTELMTSGTLREYIRKLSTPTPKIVKRWSRQILKGLAYLHSHNPPIIHRDIKCDNIFINGAHGEIKIGDMGTAENMWLGNKKYTLIGTPEFMAPEMYEERGYSEKVDIYAFGMCLLEMVTGEYPYAECTNAAQVYKKVSQHIKPESLNKVENQQVLEVINSCLSTDENERLSAQELLECSFLAVEPDVVMLSTDPLHKIVTLQVVFKGSDKLSVKFEFNVEKDTAEEVVAEMIYEQVLPERYQHWITGEINRLLRDIDNDRPLNENLNDKQDTRAVWRREKDIRTELEKAKQELAQMTDRAIDTERRLEMYQQQMIQAEERQREVVQELDRIARSQMGGSNSRRPSADIPMSDPDEDMSSGSVEPIPTEFTDDTSIDEFVRKTAAASKRDADKASEWATKLTAQDIMTVGDLRELLDEDWSAIGLTVFAVRALKNMLNSNGKSPKLMENGLDE
ncbi:signal transducing kinase of the PAK [Apophysomyces sp. BC1034]|nr:signal transducing kinase of the PAK [Apophysomyces sp. BC1015]KAG0191635.1 signal transducing kinase of the PAK [Apophysomyces sp. BC1034]